MLWLEQDRDVQFVAPAFQLHHAIGLALLGAFGQRQATTHREDLSKIGRFDRDRDAVAANEFDEARAAEIGPRRIQRKKIVDLSCLGLSG